MFFLIKMKPIKAYLKTKQPTNKFSNIKPVYLFFLGCPGSYHCYAPFEVTVEKYIQWN